MHCPQPLPFGTAWAGYATAIATNASAPTEVKSFVMVFSLLHEAHAPEPASLPAGGRLRLALRCWIASSVRSSRAADGPVVTMSRRGRFVVSANGRLERNLSKAMAESAVNVARRIDIDR
jgi:hypothetical protein